MSELNTLPIPHTKHPHLVSLNALIISSEPPIAHHCCIKERKHFPLVSFNHDQAQIWILYFMCSVFHPLCCMSLNLSCESVLVSVWVYVWLYVTVYNRRLCSVFSEQHRKHPMGKEWGALQKSLTGFYKRLNRWFKLTPIGPDNRQYYKHHSLSSNILMLPWRFMVDIYSSYKIAFNLYFCCFQHTHITLGKEHGRIHKIAFMH